jgi:hypothetical protein
MARRHEEAVLVVGLLEKDEKVREIGEAVDVVDRGMRELTKLEKRGANRLSGKELRPSWKRWKECDEIGHHLALRRLPQNQYVIFL